MSLTELNHPDADGERIPLSDVAQRLPRPFHLHTEPQLNLQTIVGDALRITSNDYLVKLAVRSPALMGTAVARAF
jgi:hypothetical protein